MATISCGHNIAVAANLAQTAGADFDFYLSRPGGDSSKKCRLRCGGNARETRISRLALP
jgi:hypothetical protein